MIIYYIRKGNGACVCVLGSKRLGSEKGVKE